MKISGNANARSFFKKHGVTDDQMMVSGLSENLNTICTEFKCFVSLCPISVGEKV